MAYLLQLALLATTVSARTVFSSVNVGDVWQGQGVAVRVPSSNAALINVSDPSIICNTGFIQPVSQTVVNVPAGGEFTAIFHHTSAGYVGRDPADPLDPTDKGPVLVYVAAVPDATQSSVSDLGWVKIWESGYDTTTKQWGSDKLFVAGGNATFTIPACLKSGQYLLRAESIGLENASSYPGAEFYMSCAQIAITNGGDATPATVSFPGAYTPASPGLVVDDLFGVTSYTTPGPAVFTC
ncbi:glycoside hydrolase family 61 protein [Plicaturopsis crispa FD-325 SS-3]|nr:glycoside hydrolase family 61 protein [Plicaturopsis crispa FD-325 SS-3]